MLDKVFEICSKIEYQLLLYNIVHCKRIEPLIDDSSTFKTRRIHVTLKYRNDASLFHNFDVGRRVEVGSSVGINPDLTKEERNARYVLRQ